MALKGKKLPQRGNMLIEKIPQLSGALRRCAMIKKLKIIPPPEALGGEKQKLNH